MAQRRHNAKRLQHKTLLQQRNKNRYIKWDTGWCCEICNTWYTSGQVKTRKQCTKCGGMPLRGEE